MKLFDVEHLESSPLV